ncbi:MAG: hypothetical protein ACI8Z1_003568 [Candidatus Azotimanducaceae bacterium]|jgi:hypothetical protein
MANLAPIFPRLQINLGKNYWEVLPVFNTEYMCVTLPGVGCPSATFVRFSDASVPESCHFTTKIPECILTPACNPLFLRMIVLAAGLLKVGTDIATHLM